MLVNRPLDGRDPSLLIGRAAQVDAVVDSVVAGGSTVVHGARGSGKTSLLNVVATRLREKEHRVTAVNAALAPDAPGLLELVADRVAGPRSVFVENPRMRGALSYLGTHEDRPTDGGRLLDAIDRLHEGLHDEYSAEHGKPAVILVDDVPRRMLDGLFGPARDALWSLGCPWVVTCDTADAAAMSDRATLFFESRVALPRLDAAQVVEVVQSRLGRDAGPDPGVLNGIIAASDGTPRAIVMAARQALGPSGARPAKEAEEAARRRAEVQARLAALGRSPAMLAAALQGMGGAASASDAQLLERLGWSRARAAQVLRQLEEHGFVTSADSRPTGSGRPRTMYRLVEELL